MRILSPLSASTLTMTAFFAAVPCASAQSTLTVASYVQDEPSGPPVEHRRRQPATARTNTGAPKPGRQSQAQLDRFEAPLSDLEH